MGLPPYGPEPYASANSATPALLPQVLKRLIMLLHFFAARKGVLLFFCHCPRGLTFGATANLVFALRPCCSLLLDEALGLEGRALSLAVGALALSNPRRLGTMASSHGRSLTRTRTIRRNSGRWCLPGTTRPRRRALGAVRLRGCVSSRAGRLGGRLTRRGRLGIRARLRPRLTRPRTLFLTTRDVDVRSALGARRGVVRHGSATLRTSSPLCPTLGKS